MQTETLTIHCGQKTIIAYSKIKIREVEVICEIDNEENEGKE